MQRREFMKCGAVLAAGVLGGRPTLAQGDKSAFSRATVVARAAELAQADYVAPVDAVPAAWAEIGYDQYRDIRFRQESRLWRGDGLNFTADAMPLGHFFRHAVRLNVVRDGVAGPFAPRVADFDLGPSAPPLPADAIAPLSGFRLRNPINTPGVWDEFLVFQGASYFRAVAKGQLYGLSARGLAIDTAEPSGEEFPVFTEFWLETPAPGAAAVVVHALLDSPSATGAYRFTVRPGAQTEMDVEATLFARRDLAHIGLAPLTSMFLFDATNRDRFDDYRPSVRDSAGLQILTSAGEHIWRPLANPTILQASAFTDRAPRGFGLIQRNAAFEEFQDLEARYEMRTSVWVELLGDWGEGAVELIEIPSPNEYNDNIFAAWRPKAGLAAGAPLDVAYRLNWGAGPEADEGLARVAASRAGKIVEGTRRLFVVDFVGPGLDPGAQAAVESTVGAVMNTVVQPNPHTGGLRASFELDVGEAALAELRLRLMSGGAPVSETWVYRWTAR